MFISRKSILIALTALTAASIITATIAGRMAQQFKEERNNLKEKEEKEKLKIKRIIEHFSIKQNKLDEIDLKISKKDFITSAVPGGMPFDMRGTGQLGLAPPTTIAPPSVFSFNKETQKFNQLWAETTNPPEQFKKGNKPADVWNPAPGMKNRSPAAKSYDSNEALVNLSSQVALLTQSTQFNTQKINENFKQISATLQGLENRLTQTTTLMSSTLSLAETMTKRIIASDRATYWNWVSNGANGCTLIFGVLTLYGYFVSIALNIWKRKPSSNRATVIDDDEKEAQPAGSSL